CGQVRGGAAGRAGMGMGILSFGLLAVAIGSDYWYLVQVEPARDPESPNSHSGLWQVCEGNGACTAARGHLTVSLAGMHRALVVMLPLSLILLLLLFHRLGPGQHRALPFLPLAGLLTLTRISVYISYSEVAFAETVRMYNQQHFDHVHISFGWSMALAWLSFSSEVLAGSLLLLAAQLLGLQQATRSMAI
uniref:Transmembrane protein 235 n=1 Tax=Gopherus evgoodei TaxID=1825980 RepID=A0A8C4Y5K6_9SAUR